MTAFTSYQFSFLSVLLLSQLELGQSNAATRKEKRRDVLGHNGLFGLFLSERWKLMILKEVKR